MVDRDDMNELLLWLIAALAVLALGVWVHSRHRQNRRRQAERSALAKAKAQAAVSELPSTAQQQVAKRAAVPHRAAPNLAPTEGHTDARSKTSRDELAAPSSTPTGSQLDSSERIRNNGVAVEPRERQHARTQRTQLGPATPERTAPTTRSLQAQIPTPFSSFEKPTESVAAAEPMVPAQADAGRAFAHSTQPRGLRRVLLVDDSRLVRVKTGRLLSQHGFEVTEAADGLDAVRLLQDTIPELVITDVEMPGLDGFALTQRLRADARTAHLPVIMITAANDRHRHDAEEAGVNVLLGKPYADDDLITQIQRLLRADVAAIPLAHASRITDKVRHPATTCA